eukprot:1493311-Prymnesium_polylepis.1
MPSLPQARYLQTYAETKAMGEKAMTDACCEDFLTCAVAPHQVCAAAEPARFFFLRPAYCRRRDAASGTTGHVWRCGRRCTGRATTCSCPTCSRRAAPTGCASSAPGATASASRVRGRGAPTRARAPLLWPPPRWRLA